MICIRRHAWIVAVACVAAAISAPAARAGQASADKSVEAGREAFQDADAPWYNSETDSLQAIEFWVPPDWELWDLRSVLNVLLWTVLIVLAGVLLLFLYRVVRNHAGHRERLPVVGRDVVVTADQIDALPFMAQRVKGDLLAQARYHYEQGDYAEAIIYLFSYQLVQLDKFSVIRLAKGKTNRQYLRETARVAPLAGALERSMLAFEGVFFGRRGLDRAAFEACWNGLPQFEQQLRSPS